MIEATVGITAHAREQAQRRLGADLAPDVWQRIGEGIAAKRWPSRDPRDRRESGRIWLVPTEHAGEQVVLPVVARRERNRRSCHVVVVTVFRLEDQAGRERYRLDVHA